MTTTTSAATPSTSLSRLWGAIAAEWTKFRSVRSTYWSLIAAAVLMIGFGALICLGTVNRYDRLAPAERAAFDPTRISLAGLFLAQLAIGVLGVLAATSEYATGMIRATFAAVPQRFTVIAAKLLVFTAVVSAGAVVVSLVAFEVGQGVLSAKSIQTTLGQPDVLRAVLGAALYITVVGILGIAFGFLLRSTGGALATLVGILLVVPILIRFLPSDLSDQIDKYTPANAGQAILQVHTDPNLYLSPWTGFALFCLYTLAVLALAVLLVQKRDA
jgi:hypothetical protein